MTANRAQLLLLALAAFLVGAGLAYGVLHYSRVVSLANSVRVSGKALIGGPFALTDHTGKRVTEKDFRGKFMLVYFGFSYCPDVCPAELQVIAQALGKLGDKAKKVTPVFITVDPERDTVEQMASYVANFDPRLVGLTGTQDEVRAAAKAYRVYYARQKDESSTAGYVMDHSSVVYLMGPDGGYLTHFAYGTKPDQMAAGIAKHLQD